MFSDFFNRLDSIDYFVSTKKELLAEKNRAMLLQLGNGLTIVVVLYLLVRFSIDPGRLPELRFWVLFAVLLAYRIEYKCWLSKILLSFNSTRLIVLLNYYLFFMASAYLEMREFDASHTPIFIALILALPAFYTDYFQVYFLIETVIGISYFAICHLVSPGTLSWQACFEMMAAIMFSLVMVLAIFGNQAESVTEEKVFKEKSDTDLLTGLKNKIAFQDESKEAIRNKPLGTASMLLILDFDNFKLVNDNYGHQTGDDVLKAFANILIREFRVVDIIGRVGGDEFMVMVPSIPFESTGLIADRCKNILHELNVLKVGKAHSFSCSIGIACDYKGMTFEEMYKLADDALYESKERGKATYTIYSSGKADE